MSLINLVAAIAKAFPDRHREQAFADLMALDDRLLADIGLRRSDIAVGCVAPPAVLGAAPQSVSRARLPWPVAPTYFPAF